jgi:hypothetical protein
MDGILKTNNLHLDQFKLDYSKDLEKRTIEISCRYPTINDENDPSVKKLLGYILFAWRPRAMDSVKLEISNFNAFLYVRNFRFGNTTKPSNKDQTGEHGEGFKIAAMVMRRNPRNYSVRTVASGREITFKFRGDNAFYASVAEINKLDSQRKVDLAEFKKLAREGKPRPLKSKSWEDVTFIFGEDRTITGKSGESHKTGRIP